jgi:hypothetical protein
MFVVCYALILKDDRGTRLATIGTNKEPQNKNGGINPRFHTFCLSAFALHPQAHSIETIAWQPGTDIEQAPVLVTAYRTEDKGVLSYSFPNGNDSDTNKE